MTGLEEMLEMFTAKALHKIEEDERVYTPAPEEKVNWIISATYAAGILKQAVRSAAESNDWDYMGVLLNRYGLMERFQERVHANTFRMKDKAAIQEMLEMFEQDTAWIRGGMHITAEYGSMTKDMVMERLRLLRETSSAEPANVSWYDTKFEFVLPFVGFRGMTTVFKMGMKVLLLQLGLRVVEEHWELS